MAREKSGIANEAKGILIDRIEPLILTIRDQKVLLDSDLARLYGTSTKPVNEQSVGVRAPDDRACAGAGPDETATTRVKSRVQDRITSASKA